MIYTSNEKITMTEQKKFPERCDDLGEKISQRIQRRIQVKEEGGNTFQQLEARLTDVDSGEMMEDIVVYAIRTIKEIPQAEDFLKGYINDIETKPDKYPEQATYDPTRYAKTDMDLALHLHFASEKTYDLWTPVIDL